MVYIVSITLLIGFTPIVALLLAVHLLSPTLSIGGWVTCGLGLAALPSALCGIFALIEKQIGLAKMLPQVSLTGVALGGCIALNPHEGTSYALHCLQMAQGAPLEIARLTAVVGKLIAASVSLYLVLAFAQLGFELPIRWFVTNAGGAGLFPWPTIRTLGLAFFLSVGLWWLTDSILHNFLAARPA